MEEHQRPSEGGVSIPTPPLQFKKATSEPLWLEEIPLATASDFVSKHHYSQVMPKQTKLSLGAFKGKEGPLIGVITFGWGVQPKNTIRRLFPTLDTTKEYLEIGKMCVHDSEPKNTESRLLSLAVSFLKKHRPQVKVLFTWADALWGKPGYVYQAANFYYGGYIQTDVYMDKFSTRFHPRQLPAKLVSEGIERKDFVRLGWGARNEIGCCRPSKEQLVEREWRHVFGLQFRYAYFLCGADEAAALITDSAFARELSFVTTQSKKGLSKQPITKTVFKPAIIWKRPFKGDSVYPKAKDLFWKVDDGKEKDGKPSRPIRCDKPEFGAAFDGHRVQPTSG